MRPKESILSVICSSLAADVNRCEIINQSNLVLFRKCYDGVKTCVERTIMRVYICCRKYKSRTGDVDDLGPNPANKDDRGMKDRELKVVPVCVCCNGGVCRLRERVTTPEIM